MCKPHQCSTTVSTLLELGYICTGQGGCLALGTLSGQIDCGDYLCDLKTAACHATCNPSGKQCKSGVLCSLSLCGGQLKPLGASCSIKGECESDKCIQGVCCDHDCGDACKTCKLPGAVGRCLPVPYGQKPDVGKSCQIKPPCGEDGTCNGQGKCRKSLAGTACGANICKDESSQSQLKIRACDGSGGCKENKLSCGNYKCQPGLTSCYGRCTTSAQCIAPTTCKVGQCTL